MLIDSNSLWKMEVFFRNTSECEIHLERWMSALLIASILKIWEVRLSNKVREMKVCVEQFLIDDDYIFLFHWYHQISFSFHFFPFFFPFLLTAFWFCCLQKMLSALGNYATTLRRFHSESSFTISTGIEAKRTTRHWCYLSIQYFLFLFCIFLSSSFPVLSILRILVVHYFSVISIFFILHFLWMSFSVIV